MSVEDLDLKSGSFFFLLRPKPLSFIIYLISSLSSVPRAALCRGGAPLLLLTDHLMSAGFTCNVSTLCLKYSSYLRIRSLLLKTRKTGHWHRLAVWVVCPMKRPRFEFNPYVTSHSHPVSYSIHFLASN